MSDQLSTCDPAENLRSDDPVANCVAEAWKTRDAAYIVYAHGVDGGAEALNGLPRQLAR